MVVSATSLYNRTMKRGLFLMILMGLVSVGCARHGFIPLEKGRAEEPENRHYISDVPFFPQSEYECGPAALASVLNYYGCRITPDEIAKAIYRKRLKGTLSMDLLLFAQGMGVFVRAYRGDLTDLKDQILKDRPLIVFQDVGYPLLPIRHFSVVIGYDDAEGTLVFHSGNRKNKVISYERFLRSWAEMDYWTLLILPNNGDADQFETPTYS
jgi:ABC-type bacteriocin/lantibiotic exporter with double-glycine peptidase domain